MIKDAWFVVVAGDVGEAQHQWLAAIEAFTYLRLAAAGSPIWYARKRQGATRWERVSFPLEDVGFFYTSPLGGFVKFSENGINIRLNR
jgi:hypothetical protein